MYKIKEIFKNKTMVLNDEKLEQYILFCFNNKTSKKQFQTEAHHILPQSIFPEYISTSWNLVNLEYSQHFEAHLLLLESIDDEGMLFAINMMSNKFNNIIDIDKFNYKHYKQRAHKLISKMFTGKVYCMERNSGIKKWVSCEEYNNEEYIHHKTGMVTVKNIDTGENEYIGIDYYNNNKDKYSHYNQDKVLCIGVNGKATKVGINQFNSKLMNTPTTNKVTVVDKNGHTSSVDKEVFYNNTLKSINSGKVVCTDRISGVTKQIDVNIYRNNKNKYTTINTQKVRVVDGQGKSLLVSTEHFNENKDLYKTVNKDKKMVRNIRSNKIMFINHSEYILNPDNYDTDCNPATNKTTVIDLIDGKTKQVSIKEFKNNTNLVGTATKFIYLVNGVLMGPNQAEKLIHKLGYKSTISAFNKLKKTTNYVEQFKKIYISDYLCGLLEENSSE